MLCLLMEQAGSGPVSRIGVSHCDPTSTEKLKEVEPGECLRNVEAGPAGMRGEQLFRRETEEGAAGCLSGI
jgi:hypothetical protein